MFAFFWRKPAFGSAGLLALPGAWFILCYLAAIGALLITAFWSYQVPGLNGLREFINSDLRSGNSGS